MHEIGNRPCANVAAVAGGLRFGVESVTLVLGIRGGMPALSKLLERKTRWIEDGAPNYVKDQRLFPLDKRHPLWLGSGRTEIQPTGRSVCTRDYYLTQPCQDTNLL